MAFPDATDWYYVETILSRDSLSMPTLGLRMPISFDEQTCSVSLKCGQYCGKYEASYIYSAFLLGDDSWSGYGSDITASGTFDYDHAEGVQYCAIDRSTREFSLFLNRWGGRVLGAYRPPRSFVHPLMQGVRMIPDPTKGSL